MTERGSFTNWLLGKAESSKRRGHFDLLAGSNWRVGNRPAPSYHSTQIGLFENKFTIDLFSLHIELTGDLAKGIAQAQRKRK